MDKSKVPRFYGPRCSINNHTMQCAVSEICVLTYRPMYFAFVVFSTWATMKNNDHR